MVQGVSFVQIFELRICSFIVHDTLNVLERELFLFLNDLNQWNLIHQVNIVDRTAKGPQQVYERYLSINCTVQQRCGSVNIKDIRSESFFEQVL